MILKQYYLNCLAHASYLLGDGPSGTAILVDPQRDIAQYLADAQALNLTIRHVFLTHFHADFIAGHLELRDVTGAAIHLGAQAKADYAFTPMHDGDTLTFPSLRLQILETPGHTIESISLLVFDLTKDSHNPAAILTGDTLFLGDVGRPDLRASLGYTANQLGAHLYDSLHNKILPLPDETLVYPAHGAGSLCGKQLSSDTVSTLGTQRKFNYALQPMSREQFIALVTADQPDAPPYFNYDAILNTREHPTLTTNLARVLYPVALDDLLAQQASGAQILDVRDAADFAAGHLRGALNIGLGGQYATWAGTVLDRIHPILLIAEPSREEEAALRLGRIGFDDVRGYLADSMASLLDRPELLTTTTRVSPQTTFDSLAEVTVLDVRNPREYASAHIAGSVNIPLNHLQSRLTELSQEQPIAVHCAGGYRSSIAASILQHAGHTHLTELSGGLAAWQSANLPVTSDLHSLEPVTST